ncbi:hypothetical protein [Terrihabitans sp. B22-R8]|uniref:hypothetical protein n=1 Tax=Terrihabitans sp. B22-R8 TaxID=3425128 RepID=UPI00403C1CEB
MTPGQARATYRRMLGRRGETISVRRGGKEHPALARVTGFAPEELVGEIQQGDRKVILFAEGLGIEPTDQDDLIVRGSRLAIKSVDDSTRRVAGELIAYEIVARG